MSHGFLRSQAPRWLSSLLIVLTLAVVIAGSAAATGPTTGILDDFNRAGENPLTQWGNWASDGISGGTPLPLSGSQLVHGNSGTAYRSQTLSGDMEA